MVRNSDGVALSNAGNRNAPNLVTKILGRFASEVLAPAGIEYKTKRTGQSRLMRFRKSDSNDDDDGENAI